MNLKAFLALSASHFKTDSQNGELKGI